MVAAVTDVAELKRKLATSRRVIRRWQNAHNELCKERAKLLDRCQFLAQEVEKMRRRGLLSSAISCVTCVSTLLLLQWWAAA